MPGLIYGLNAAYGAQPLKVDASGNLKTAEQGTPQVVFPGGGQPFTFSGVVLRAIGTASLAAGTNNIDDSAVPAGEIWVITNLRFQYTGTPPTRVNAALVSGGTGYPLFAVLAPASGQDYDRQGFWVMAEGDVLRVSVTGATLNDDLYLHATGFKTDL